jgi:thiol-disulfide isomerase/thioredoxin
LILNLQLIVVDFHALWCAPCKIIGKEIDRLAGTQEYKEKVCFIKVDSRIMKVISHLSSVKQAHTAWGIRGGRRRPQASHPTPFLGWPARRA